MSNIISKQVPMHHSSISMEKENVVVTGQENVARPRENLQEYERT